MQSHGVGTGVPANPDGTNTSLTLVSRTRKCTSSVTLRICCPSASLCVPGLSKGRRTAGRKRHNRFILKRRARCSQSRESPQAAEPLAPLVMRASIPRRLRLAAPVSVMSPKPAGRGPGPGLGRSQNPPSRGEPCPQSRSRAKPQAAGRRSVSGVRPVARWLARSRALALPAGYGPQDTTHMPNRSCGRRTSYKTMPVASSNVSRTPAP